MSTLICHYGVVYYGVVLLSCCVAMLVSFAFLLCLLVPSF